MPVDLPGFYWDAQRNRYFPLSSKPKMPSVTQPIIPKSDHPAKSLKRKRKNSLWNITETSRATCFTHKRYQATHEILCSHYATTSSVTETKVPTFGHIKSFCSTVLNGEVRRFIGDNRGWLYNSTPLSSGHNLWAADINLRPESEISSICISGARCIATCFGPSPKVSVQDLNLTGRTFLLSLTGVHDIWNAHLQDNALVLGANKKAVFLSDIDISNPPIQTLDTHSDVFAVYQKDNMIYTGCRNGSILRFDKRTGKHGVKLYDDRFEGKARSSVLHLDTIADSQLLVSHMNGDLLTFDLRFPQQSTPIVQYLGHVNSYTQKLGIGLDPDQDFLFAAGEDKRIRGWSVRSGLPLLPPSSGVEADDRRNPFLFQFPNTVETLQVIVENKSMCLWAPCDRTLYQFLLGQR